MHRTFIVLTTNQFLVLIIVIYNFREHLQVRGFSKEWPIMLMLHLTLLVHYNHWNYYVQFYLLNVVIMLKELYDIYIHIHNAKWNFPKYIYLTNRQERSYMPNLSVKNDLCSLEIWSKSKAIENQTHEKDYFNIIFSGNSRKLVIKINCICTFYCNTFFRCKIMELGIW